MCANCSAHHVISIVNMNHRLKSYYNLKLFHFTLCKIETHIGFKHNIFFTPQPLRAVGVLFSPMVSGWAGGQWEKVCPGCISETVRG